MIKDIPSLAALKERMRFLQTRQKVLAQNVANADTPGYRPKDLFPGGLDPTSLGRNGPRPQAAAMPAVPLMRTDAAHLEDPERAGGGAEGRGMTYDTRPSGNAVSLEDEMLKVSQNQGDFQAAANLYQRSLSTIKLALGRRV